MYYTMEGEGLSQGYFMGNPVTMHCALFMLQLNVLLLSLNVAMGPVFQNASIVMDSNLVQTAQMKKTAVNINVCLIMCIISPL